TDAGRPEPLDRAAHALGVPRDIETTLGGELLAPLGHEAGVLGANAEREGHHRVGHRHLEVQLDAQPAAELLHVPLLDVAPVLAQVHGDAVRARGLGVQRRRDGVRVVDPARLPEGGDVVDVDAEAEHGRTVAYRGDADERGENLGEETLLQAFSAMSAQPAGHADRAQRPRRPRALATRATSSISHQRTSRSSTRPAHPGTRTRPRAAVTASAYRPSRPSSNTTRPRTCGST